MSYLEKKKELEAKYRYIIALISEKENVDMGVAFDMFESNVENGSMYGWRDAEKDFADLTEAARGEVIK